MFIYSFNYVLHCYYNFVSANTDDELIDNITIIVLLLRCVSPTGRKWNGKTH